MQYKPVVSAGLLFFSLYVNGHEPEPEQLEKLFQEKGRDYPGCVFIVRDEIQHLDPATNIEEVAPLLLDTCIKGRTIGEKRMQKMYDIDPVKDKPKKKNFSIRLAPLNEVNNEKNILYKDDF